MTASDFTAVEKKLASVKVKHPTLPKARVAAFRAALGERSVADVFGEIFPAELVQAQLVRAQNYLRTSSDLCVPLHHAVLVERHLKLPEGTIYIALYHTEGKNFATLKKEYVLMANPVSLKPGDPVPAAPAAGDAPPLTLQQERLAALMHAMNEKGLKNATQLGRAVYPKDATKANTLGKRMSSRLKGAQMVTEVDVHEIANALGVAPSVLIVRKDDAPAPPSPPKKPTAPSVDPPASSPVAAMQLDGAPHPGLLLSLGIGNLVQQNGIQLTGYDTTTRTFSSADGKFRARVRNQGGTFSLEIMGTAEIPPDRLGALVALILPPQE